MKEVRRSFKELSTMVMDSVTQNIGNPQAVAAMARALCEFEDCIWDETSKEFVIVADDQNGFISED